MTVSPTTKQREQDKLMVTDAELLRRIGMPEESGRQVLRYLDNNRSGFPAKQKLWGDRRWWPAVERWFERHYGSIDEGAARLIPENRNRNRPPSPSFLRRPAEGLNHEDH